MTRYRCRWWQRHLWTRWELAGSGQAFQFRRCNACGKYGMEAL